MGALTLHRSVRYGDGRQIRVRFGAGGPGRGSEESNQGRCGGGHGSAASDQTCLRTAMITMPRRTRPPLRITGVSPRRHAVTRDLAETLGLAPTGCGSRSTSR